MSICVAVGEENIGFYGTFSIEVDRELAQLVGGYRPLRLGESAPAEAPYSPEGRGKQERLNRYIRERFLTEATHVGIERLNNRFAAWVELVANRRTHAETGMTPEARFAAGGPPRAAEPARRSFPCQKGLFADLPPIGPAAY